MPRDKRARVVTRQTEALARKSPSVWGRCLSAALGLSLATLAPSWAMADHFDDHHQPVLSKVADFKGAVPVTELPVNKIARFPKVLEGEFNNAFLVVRTGDFNWAKLLVRQGKFTPAGKEPMDMVLVERLTTYPANPAGRMVANRKEIYLFEGFGLDLDGGHVVPPDSGEDLKLVRTDKGLVLQAVGDAKMYALGKPMISPQVVERRSFSQGIVQPEDFSGRYHLDGDGRWTGQLDLAVNSSGEVKGTFASDETGQVYELSGEVGHPTNHIEFSITFPRTAQTFSGYLWTRGRSQIAGVTSMEGQTFGFVARRESADAPANEAAGKAEDAPPAEKTAPTAAANDEPKPETAPAATAEKAAEAPVDSDQGNEPPKAP